MMGSSWAAAQLAASQEGLSSMELDGQYNGDWRHCIAGSDTDFQPKIMTITIANPGPHR
jgi:hypothetical protein